MLTVRGSSGRKPCAAHSLETTGITRITFMQLDKPIYLYNHTSTYHN